MAKGALGVKQLSLACTTLLIGVALAFPGLARHELTIGNSNVVVKTVTGEIGDEKRVLQLNDDVYFNEAITTMEESATEITFLDGTKLTLGEDTEVVLDKFIYDPDPSNSQFVLSLSKGVMRFVSGSMPSEAYKIHTPVGTVGIRGSVIDIVCIATQQVEVDGELVERCVEVEVVNQEGTVLYTCEGETVEYSTSGYSATCRENSPPTEPTIASAEAQEEVENLVETILSALEPGAGPTTGDEGEDEEEVGDEGTDVTDVTEVQNDIGDQAENAGQDTSNDDGDSASLTGGESGG